MIQVQTILKNPNLFTITTIAAGDWIIGDPSHIVNGKVETKRMMNFLII